MLCHHTLPRQSCPKTVHMPALHPEMHAFDHVRYCQLPPHSCCTSFCHLQTASSTAIKNSIDRLPSTQAPTDTLQLQDCCCRLHRFLPLHLQTASTADPTHKSSSTHPSTRSRGSINRLHNHSALCKLPSPAMMHAVGPLSSPLPPQPLPPHFLLNHTRAQLSSQPTAKQL